MAVALKFLKRLARDRKAATAVEYGLIVALIVIAMLTGLFQLSGGVRNTWGYVSNSYTKAAGG